MPAGDFLTKTQLTEASAKKRIKKPKRPDGNPAMIRGVPLPLVMQAKRNDSTSPYYKSLAEVIRTIGAEVIDQKSGWTRLEALVRSIYADAIGGKTAAAELILERGWGKVPTAVALDISGEIRQMVISSGITQDDIEADPVLKSLIETSGAVLEGVFSDLKEDKSGLESTETDAGQGETGINPA